jgi:hypothetical protein
MKEPKKQEINSKPKQKAKLTGKTNTAKHHHTLSIVNEHVCVFIILI